jgi:hypothetical protein
MKQWERISKRLSAMGLVGLFMLAGLPVSSADRSMSASPPQSSTKSVGGQQRDQKAIGGRTRQPTSPQSPEAPTPRSGKWAVLIGVSVDGLQYAHADALLLYETLCNTNGFEPEHVYLLLRHEQHSVTELVRRYPIPSEWIAETAAEFKPDKHRVAPATSETIQRLLSYLGDRATSPIRTGDTFLFFFSGHGTAYSPTAESEADAVFLQIEPLLGQKVMPTSQKTVSIAVEQEKSVTVQPEKTVGSVQQPRTVTPAPTPSQTTALLPLSRLRQSLETSRATTQIVILDACRSGNAVETDVHGVMLRRLFGINRAPDNPNPAYVVMLSCTAGQFSIEDSEYLQHGVFAYFLARALNGAADINRDGQLTIAELKDYLEATMPNFTQNYIRGFQTPLISHTAGSAALFDCPASRSGLVIQTAPGNAEVWVKGIVNRIPIWRRLPDPTGKFDWEPEYEVKVSHQNGQVQLRLPAEATGATSVMINFDAWLQMEKRSQKGFHFVISYPSVGTLSLEIPSTLARALMTGTQPLQITFYQPVKGSSLLKLSNGQSTLNIPIPETAIPYGDEFAIRFERIHLQLPAKQEDQAAMTLEYRVRIGQIWLPKIWEGKIPLPTLAARRVQR